MATDMIYAAELWHGPRRRGASADRGRDLGRPDADFRLAAPPEIADPVTTPVPWLDYYQVNTGAAATGSQFNAQTIGLANGNYLVAWVDEGNGVSTTAGADITGKIYDAEGNLVRDAYRLNTARASQEEHAFDLVATADGGFLMVYSSGSQFESDNGAHLYWERYDSSGSSIDSLRLVDVDGDDNVDDPQVTIDLLSGASIVTWQQYEGGGLTSHEFVGRIVSPSGFPTTTFAAGASDNDLVLGGDVAMLTGGRFVTAYREEDAGVFRPEAGIFDNAGNLITRIAIAASEFETYDLQIAALSNGNWVATWWEQVGNDGDIFFRIFNANGAPVTSVRTAAGGAISQISPDIVALPDGDFVISWGESNETLAQRYNANGALDGGIFTVAPNSTNTNSGLTADGRLLFASSGDEVHASIWDPRGGTIFGFDYHIAGQGRIFLDTEVLTTRLGSTAIFGSSGITRILAQGGNDTIYGSEEFELILGRDGNDMIVAGAGNDTIVAGVGSDSVDGGFDADSIDGGLGNDTLIGGQGSDIILGDAGFDSILGGEGADSILGGAAYDTIRGGEGADSIDGGDSHDVIEGGQGSDLLNGGAGYDRVSYESSSAAVNVAIVNDPGGGTGGAPHGRGGDIAVNSGGDAAGDRLAGFEGIQGSAFNDTIAADQSTIGYDAFGGDGADSILGSGDAQTGGGDDYLAGEAGADSILGGFGADYIDGGAHNDLLNGNAGDDYLFGEAGADSILGGATGFGLFNRGGNDYLSGGAGVDTLRGDVGNDTLIGGIGGDVFDGAAGIDWADYSPTVGRRVTADLQISTNNTGEALGDSYISIENLRGGSFIDNLRGDGAANRLEGEDRNDVLAGRAGDDTLVGGYGFDQLAGQQGIDSFLLTSAHPADYDRIVDFAVNETILLDGDAFGWLAPGALDPDAFVLGAGAEDAEDRLIYLESVGKLFFDPDGVGGESRVLIAIIENRPALDASHFTVI